jgi:hypothetical protein
MTSQAVGKDSMKRTRMTTIAITALAVFAVAVMPLDSVRAASKEKVLQSFDYQGDNKGQNPSAPVVFDAAGNLYSTTQYGGGAGNVFELKPGAHGKWTEKVLHVFNNTDGNFPLAGVVFDAAGNLYGTTKEGGKSTACGGNTCGTVFELIPGANGKWTEKVLHNFAGTDGSNPVAGLIFDAAGNLYGSTCGGYPPTGTVFELIRGAHHHWREKVLYSASGFCGSNLVFDKVGNLYGISPDYAGTLGSCSSSCTAPMASGA